MGGGKLFKILFSVSCRAGSGGCRNISVQVVWRSEVMG